MSDLPPELRDPAARAYAAAHGVPVESLDLATDAAQIWAVAEVLAEHLWSESRDRALRDETVATLLEANQGQDRIQCELRAEVADLRVRAERAEADLAETKEELDEFVRALNAVRRHRDTAEADLARVKWVQKVGPAWLHAGKSCAETEADLARARPVVDAAEALVEFHRDPMVCSPAPMTAELIAAIADALARSVSPDHTTNKTEEN